MDYLITKIALCLLLAFLLGLVIGWLLHRLLAGGRERRIAEERDDYADRYVKMENERNAASIRWTSPVKIMWRFMTAPFKKRDLFEE